MTIKVRFTRFYFAFLSICTIFAPDKLRLSMSAAHAMQT